MLIGLSLVVASAGVFNNYLDRDIDRKMDRTKNRALAAGKIPTQIALVYATILGWLGFSILLLGTNFLAASVAWTGFVVYLLLYSPLKRRLVHATIIGSISGATPPVVGYTAASNNLDSGALGLFLILVFWQMPHFYAIAIYRYGDYKAAGVAVLPVIKGRRAAKLQILLYMVGFMAAVSSLTLLGYTGYIYLVLALVVALSWFWRALRGLSAKDDRLWARGVFRHSLLVITLLSVLIAVGAVLP
jgi:protoheme IX farnesyltransferase